MFGFPLSINNVILKVWNCIHEAHFICYMVSAEYSFRNSERDKDIDFRAPLPPPKRFLLEWGVYNIHNSISGIYITTGAYRPTKIPH